MAKNERVNGREKIRDENVNFSPNFPHKIHLSCFFLTFVVPENEFVPLLFFPKHPFLLITY